MTILIGLLCSAGVKKRNTKTPKRSSCLPPFFPFPFYLETVTHLSSVTFDIWWLETDSLSSLNFFLAHLLFDLTSLSIPGIVLWCFCCICFLPAPFQRKPVSNQFYSVNPFLRDFYFRLSFALHFASLTFFYEAELVDASDSKGNMFEFFLHLKLFGGSKINFIDFERSLIGNLL